jgi:hypothetical protein
MHGKVIKKIEIEEKTSTSASASNLIVLADRLIVVEIFQLFVANVILIIIIIWLIWITVVVTLQ